MQQMVDSLQLSGEGKTVAMAFNIPSEFFDALEAMARQKQERSVGQAEGKRQTAAACRTDRRRQTTRVALPFLLSALHFAFCLLPFAFALIFCPSHRG